MQKSKIIIVSAVNFTEGGGLTVLRECLAAAARLTFSGWRVVAIVHDRKLINQKEIELIEMPASKRSWLSHLYHEWYLFRQISKQYRPDLWLSLHDITPLVKSRRQAVYCHNAAPFYKMKWSEIRFSPTFWVFTLVYKYLYRLFIWKNTYVIVQQQWLRQAFVRMFGNLPLVVAHPNIISHPSSKIQLPKTEAYNHKVFLYPAIPRSFKNFELICEAAKILEARKVSKFEVRLTTNGQENAYGAWLYAKYKNIKSISFIGLQSGDNLRMQYQTATAVIFPSKLETWGLPISEAKSYDKPLLVADLPYAHETVGIYKKVSFFPPLDAKKLAGLMQALIDDTWQPEGSSIGEPPQPFVKSWDDLWALLTQGL